MGNHTQLPIRRGAKCFDPEHPLAHVERQALCDTLGGCECLQAQNAVFRLQPKGCKVFCETCAGANLVVDLAVQHKHATSVAPLQHASLDQFINCAAQCVAVYAESHRKQTLCWQAIS